MVRTLFGHRPSIDSESHEFNHSAIIEILYICVWHENLANVGEVS